MENTFNITWENEFKDDISTPLEAAKQCLKDIVNGETLMFTVTDKTTGIKYSVDLGEDDEDAVIIIN